MRATCPHSCPKDHLAERSGNSNPVAIEVINQIYNEINKLWESGKGGTRTLDPGIMSASRRGEKAGG